MLPLNTLKNLCLCVSNFQVISVAYFWTHIHLSTFYITLTVQCTEYTRHCTLAVTLTR